MGYISEFSTDIRYVQGSKNFVADTLFRVQINGVETLQDGINYQQVANSTISSSASPQAVLVQPQQYHIFRRRG